MKNFSYFCRAKTKSTAMQMKRIATLTALLAACLVTTNAQPLASTAKPAAEGNPISASIYCADPTALEYEGRLYVYGTNDHQQFLANGRTGGNSYGAIRQIVMFSTDDLVNWTFHGIIDTSRLCGQWCFASWAPSIVSRREDDGLTHFYLYFSNSGAGIGVLTATSPTGPWTSPLDHALVDGSSPGVAPCNWPFDPGVVIDDEGQGWLAFGGGDPNYSGSDLLPGNARIIRLNDDMISYQPDNITTLPAPYHFEANELNIIGGRFVYTYCNSWSGRDAWASYGSSQPAPGACSMAYMTTDNPMDKTAWQYRGEYLLNPGMYGFPWGNNHTHLQKYGSDYYLLYHTQTLEKAFSADASGFRSIGINRAFVDEATQTITRVEANKAGVSPLKALSPYERQQAETMATAGGITFEDFTTTAPDVQVAMEAGDWTMVRHMDFGSEGAKAFIARAQGTGTIEVRLDRADAQPVASLSVASAEPTDQKIAGLSATTLSGLHDVYLVCTSAAEFRLDAWQFFHEDNPEADIRQVAAEAGRPKVCYSLDGRQVKNPRTGLYIIDGRKTLINPSRQ